MDPLLFYVLEAQKIKLYVFFRLKQLISFCLLLFLKQ